MVRVDCCKEMLENTKAVPQETFIISSLVTKHGSVRMSRKQSNSPPCGSLNSSQIQRKSFVEKSFRSRWSPVSSGHVATVPLDGTILGGKPQFDWLKSWEKFEKATREEQSLFTMAMSALTRRLKSAPY